MMTLNQRTGVEAPQKRIFLDSTSLLGDGAALRARAADEGYLFFKSLLPVEDVSEVRADLLEVVEQFGWRADGADPWSGALEMQEVEKAPAEAMRLDIGVTSAMYQAAQKRESLHRLPHHPRLIAVYAALFECEPFVHPRHIARMVTPHPAMTPTPAHQDFPLIQGSFNTWTCWFPLGDCPRTLGGLSVLRGSHQLGTLPVQPASGAGGISAQLCPWENQWVEGDFSVGDVLTFPCHTVHKALPCRHADQIRLSLDVRYQPADEEIEARSLSPHCELSWEEIYADWKQDDLKYYWREHEMELVPYSDSYHQPARRIC